MTIDYYNPFWRRLAFVILYTILWSYKKEYQNKYYYFYIRYLVPIAEAMFQAVITPMKPEVPREATSERNLTNV